MIYLILNINFLIRIQIVRLRLISYIRFTVIYYIFII